MDLWIAAAACHISKLKGFIATLMCYDGSSHDCVLPLSKHTVCIFTVYGF